jgi:prepilin-type N-terminal cleavage/methylation domain-containing protein
MNSKYPSRLPSNGFTFVELIVSVGILAVVVTLVTLVINPVELFAQARDAQRISDVIKLGKTIEWMTIAGKATGTTNRVYVSVHDQGSWCPTYAANLPTPNPGWYILCTDNTPTLVNGLGWLPFDFSGVLDNLSQASPSDKAYAASLQMSYSTEGAPLSALPVDPRVDVPKGYYYGYARSSKGFEFVAKMESKKYSLAQAQFDGGGDTSRFEVGSDLTAWSTAVYIPIIAD